MMQKKVSEEGDNEQMLFDKYMCYCKSSEQTLSKSISDATTKIPQLESAINAGTAEKAQLQSDIAQAQKDKDSATKSMEEAKSMRAKEAEAFKKEDTQNKQNVGAMTKALASLRKGAPGSFLQSSSSAVLRHLAETTELSEYDRQTLTGFLSSSSQSDEDSDQDENEPDSNEIIGIISQIKENTEKEIQESTEAERKAQADHDDLISAKTKEVQILMNQLETKTARLGEVGVELVDLKADLADTEKLLARDRKFYADLDKGCKDKQREWNERTRTRADELVALAETIKVLNNDQVTHLFRKTMAAPPSLLQVQMSEPEMVHEARQALLKTPGVPHDPRLNLISMSMRGKKVNFDKVIAMVDKMIRILGQEQNNDDQKKTYCTQEFRDAEDHKARLADSIADHVKTIANSEALVATMLEDIKKIAAGIRALNAAVADATKQRRAQNTAFTEELAANTAAIEILEVAKDRLNHFYNPKLGQPKAKGQFLQKGTNSAAAPAPSGGKVVAEAFSFLQTAAGPAAAPAAAQPQAPAGPGAPPDTWGEKGAKSDSSGVMALLDTLIKDTRKQVFEAKAEEKDAQFEYEQFVKDSSEKHAADAKAISVKESAKAEAEAELQKRGKELKTARGAAAANQDYLTALHKQCDWLLKNHKVRRQARDAEIAALRQSQGVLSGADYSFLQETTEVRHSLRKLSRH